MDSAMDEKEPEKIIMVIGKNFGDEGKGQGVHYFAKQASEKNETVLVIRHNGGAQAGHTVELPSGERFIFHQLSAGSFAGAETLWSETFLPDLYKVGEEWEQFDTLAGWMPTVRADERCRCVYIDDVLINMAVEQSRGDRRHGSCGMGINECVQRSKVMPLHLGSVCRMDAQSLYSTLCRMREQYVPQRLKVLGLKADRLGAYGEMLTDRTVLYHAAEQMKRNTEHIALFEEQQLSQYDTVIFEGAQGLLLDEDYLKYAPHLTSSKTGSCNPAGFCRKYLAGQKVQLVYVTRTYVTRHGSGPLPYEGRFDPLYYQIVDRTNLPNEWQGTLRFSVHGSTEEFLSPVVDDLRHMEGIDHRVTCMLTHTDETKGKVCTDSGEVDVLDFLEQLKRTGVFEQFYLPVR